MASFAIQPTTLIMRKHACFYCDADPENDERTEYGGDVGIRYCAAHKTSAKRDSNAYLHEKKKVRTTDGVDHPILGPFLTGLLKPTAVLRSDGSWQDGWTLQHGLTAKHEALTCGDGVWHIPMMNTELEIAKRVPLPNFADPANPACRGTWIAAAVPHIQSVLDAGIYSDDYKAVQSLATPIVDIGETPGIGYILHKGLLVRTHV